MYLVCQDGIRISLDVDQDAFAEIRQIGIKWWIVEEVFVTIPQDISGKL